MRTRKPLIALAGAVLVSLALAACSSSPSDPAEPTAAGDPVAGGTLTWAMPGEPAAGGVDPMVGTGLINYFTMDQVYETLLTKDDTGTIQPGLALSYEQPDDLTYVFTLREGVQFADGTPFTASDVVYSFESYLESQISKKAYLIGLEDIAADDDTTVTFQFSEPNGTFIDAVSHRETFFIVSEAWHSQISEEERQRKAMGTGPFELVEWTDGVSLDFVANENYWDGAAPYLDELVFEVIPDESTRLAALQQGTVDAAWFGDGTIAGQAVDAGFTLGDLAYTQGLPIFINPESGALSDIRVRQAMSLAIDRQAIIDTVFFGDGEISFVAPAGDPNAPVPDADTPYYERDVDQAIALLEEAGQPNPTITINYFGETIQNQHPMYELMQQQLAEAGITLELNPMPTAEISQIFTTGASFEDLVSLPWSYRANPAFYYDPFLSDAGAMNHWQGNPEAADAIELLAESKTITDIDEQASIIEELNGIVTENVLVLVPAALPQNYQVWNSDVVQGYTTDPYTSRYNLKYTWLAE